MDLTNPQSLNRYVYVVNSPTNLTDALGLEPNCGTDTNCWSAWAKGAYPFYGGAVPFPPSPNWNDPFLFLGIFVPSEGAGPGAAFFANYALFSHCDKNGDSLNCAIF